jgi:hypothetical protein
VVDVEDYVSSEMLQAEIVPLTSNPDIRQRLACSIETAVCICAAIAYWTVTPTFVSGELPRLLAKQDSFLCVDIHYPTDIDQLDPLAKNGANVLVHLRELGSRTELQNKGMPEHLMHAKLLLFDMPDGTAELWSGSHNWTQRALVGPNLEASLVLTIRQNSEIYRQARATLDSIRSFCSRYRPELRDYYKWLQGGAVEGVVRVISLRGHEVAHLKDAVIGLFGSDDEDFQNLRVALRTVEEAVILAVTDCLTGHQYLYHARVLHAGLLGAAEPGASGLAFSERRYAEQQGRELPMLEPAAVPRLELVARAYFFSTLEVQSHALPREYELASVPEDERWIGSPHDPLVERMPPASRVMLNKRGLRMKVAAMEAPTTQQERLPLEVRMAPQPKLVTRQILLRPNVAEELREQQGPLGLDDVDAQSS